MKKIDLDSKSYEFFLGEDKCNYKYCEEDKKYYLSSILELNEKENNNDNLKEIFSFILKKQNPLIIITKNDIVPLFNFFNSIFL